MPIGRYWSAPVVCISPPPPESEPFRLLNRCGFGWVSSEFIRCIALPLRLVTRHKALASSGQSPYHPYQ